MRQGPALEALWLQCCSDCALVRSACCDAVVQLVDQGHADLNYILNSVLNLLPSARYGDSVARETHWVRQHSPVGLKDCDSYVFLEVWLAFLLVIVMVSLYSPR